MTKKDTMKHIEKIFGVLLVLFAVGWNLWTYRWEPTASIDPNDNTFQYALVDRTNQILDYAQQSCATEKLKLKNENLPFLEKIFAPLNTFTFCISQFTFLLDHWVPNWAQGYNLPYYYSHMPQIMIVLSWRFFDWIIGLLDYSFIGLFQWYHWVIYLLLCLFPLSLYLSLVSIGLSPFSAGIGALIASHLSTDGLYGLDPASFLWRGYGLSSQLFAMIWLPLALAYAYKYFAISNQLSVIRIPLSFLRVTDYQLPITRELLLAIFFLTATTSGHLGIGMIAFLSVGILTISPTLSTILSQTWDKDTLSALLTRTKRMVMLLASVGLLLGYWILPILLYGDYHNISFWDPVWKFDSYGAKEVIIRLLNGELFDFGRLPVLTLLVFVGFLSSLSFRATTRNPLSKNWIPDQVRDDSIPQYFSFGILFVFWLLMYFGRTTWGGLIDLIPGMADFHLSRFIVGIHIAGLFLIPIGLEWIISRITNCGLRITKHKHFNVFAYLCIGLFIYLTIMPQTTKYAAHNDVLIKQANENYLKSSSDADSLILHLTSLISANPGRVFAGRGGSWGRDFQVAETPYYMHLSTHGIPTVLWLPQTWSPNSDTEQYFSEDQLKDYILYNIRYVVTPNGERVEPQPFWTLIKESPSWRLYEVEIDGLALSGAEGYISTGIRPAIVSSDKQSFINVVRLWIQSEYHTLGLFPELTFDASYPKPTGLPNFRMTDAAMYKVTDGTLHSVFAEVPRYMPPDEAMKRPTIVSQSQDADMVFRATVEVPEDCMQCLVILKQTAHPSWQATIDGKPVEPITVFPFYNAIVLTEPGKYEVVFSYLPSKTKMGLLCLAFIIALGSFFVAKRQLQHK
jgi:hypothetical protein